MHGEMTESLRAGPALATPDTERPPMGPRTTSDVAPRASTEPSRWSSLDALRDPAGVVDAQGSLAAVNAAWSLAQRHGGLRLVEGVVGMNYMSQCRAAVSRHVDGASALTESLRAVLTGDRPHAEFHYAAHPYGTERWVQCLVTRCQLADGPGAVVQHVDVTAQRRQERIASLAQGVVRLMEREVPPRELTPRLISLLAETLGWPLAAVWSWDAEGRTLRCDGIHPQRSGGRGWGALTNTAGLAARVWQTGIRQWSDRVEREDLAVARTALGAAASQCVEAFATPLRLSPSEDGVVVFYASHRHRPDDEVLETAARLLVGASWTAPGVSSSPPPHADPVANATSASSARPLQKFVALAALSAAPVLLQGERGAGKSRVAREIHDRSERARGRSSR